jgi:hypothetical protein
MKRTILNMAAMAVAMATASQSIAFNDWGGGYPTPGYQPGRGRGRYRSGKSKFQARVDEMIKRKAVEAR